MLRVSAAVAAMGARRLLQVTCRPCTTALAVAAKAGGAACWRVPPSATCHFSSRSVHFGVPGAYVGWDHAAGAARRPAVRAASGGRGGGESGGATSASKAPARLAQKQQLLEERTLENSGFEDGPVPRITEEHVTIGFARSGGPGGQNVNKVNTKVDMRFNVLDATWLPERVRLKLLEQEKNRINSDGELVISSTRTRTQKGNIEDALEKLQIILDKAAYVPPPPSEEKKKRINKLAKAENERRLGDKKKASSKKTERRNKGSWD